MTEPMTDAEIKQAIERHRLTVVPPGRDGLWNVRQIDQMGKWLAYDSKPTLTEAVAAVVRQIEETQK